MTGPQARAMLVSIALLSLPECQATMSAKNTLGSFTMNMNRQFTIPAAFVMLFASSPLLLADDHGESAPAAETAEVEEGFVSLFNGETLEGWACDTDWWRVEDGAMVAGSMEQDVPRTGYAVLVDQPFYNFELRLQAKLEGPRRGNGGIQFRSTYNPETGAMAGYQADMGHVYWGRIYDQGGKRHLLTAHPEDFDLEEDINLDGWNDYVIRCEGPHVRIWINGKLLADYTEQDEEIAAQAGLIGLQLHFGPASVRHYRNIRIKELD